MKQKTRFHSSNELSSKLLTTPDKKKPKIPQKREIILNAPFCLKTPAQIGTHYEFIALEKVVLMEVNLKVFQRFSMNQSQVIRNSFESAKRIGFEDMDLIHRKFDDMQKFTRRKRNKN